MKKLLYMLRVKTASKLRKGMMGQRENSDWMRSQLQKMSAMNQEIISVKAVRA